jgi:WD40 repeat protein
MDVFRLATRALTLCACIAPGAVSADDADIYAIKFSQDGKYLVTGGAAGNNTAYDKSFSGGVKIWNSDTGALIKGFGQLSHLNEVFGTNYGRMGVPTLAINNYRDIVINGSYPNGRIIVLPTSLGTFTKARSTTAPEFIGGYFNLNGGSDGNQLQRLAMNHGEEGQENCGTTRNPKDYIGPIVASDDGGYAAMVVNTCRVPASTGDKNGKDVQVTYDSSLFVIDLSSFSMVKYFHHIDTGVHALGISNNGKHVAYVGAQSFTVLDVEGQGHRVIEKYQDTRFSIPMQFSELFFSEDGKKLVSLRNIYNIETGEEQALHWKNEMVAKARGRMTSVKVSPDLKYFALVMTETPRVNMDKDGNIVIKEARHDSVVLMDTQTGKTRELDISDQDLVGKFCTTDISNDSQRVAIGCMNGIVKVFNANTGNMIWGNRNVGYKNKVPAHLMQVRDTTADPSGGGQVAMTVDALFPATSPWQ